MKRAIYPGSFDPLTLGHLDMIKRSAKIVDELVIGVLNNSAKNSLFSLDERVSMIKEMTESMHRRIMWRIRKWRRFFSRRACSIPI